MALSDRLLKAWYEGHPALALLRPLESLYRRVVQGKRARFLAGEGEIYQSPVPVVVVGNITVGGTGKTPLILWLIEHCRRSGLRVGVVSRGYGAKPPQLPWRVEASHSADVAGDEPLLIVQRCGVPLMIDPDRSRAVKALLASLDRRGVRCHVQQGNRDFLLGRRFARDSRCTLLGDYATIEDQHGTILLTHGDLLCSGDVDYQRFRSEEHTSELQSRLHLVCRLLLEKKKS